MVSSSRISPWALWPSLVPTTLWRPPSSRSAVLCSMGIRPPGFPPCQLHSQGRANYLFLYSCQPLADEFPLLAVIGYVALIALSQWKGWCCLLDSFAVVMAQAHTNDTFHLVGLVWSGWPTLCLQWYSAHVSHCLRYWGNGSRGFPCPSLSTSQLPSGVTNLMWGPFCANGTKPVLLHQSL